MEETARNMDRLVTSGAGWAGRPDRWIIPALYEAASSQLGGKPISLEAAERLKAQISPGDRVFLTAQFAYFPNMPYGETDGPPGVASLARAIRFGLGALPVLVTGPRDVEVARRTTQAAGLNVLDYSEAKGYNSAVAAAVEFPILDEGESKAFACSLLDEYAPAAVITVETIGPNRKGVKHSGSGLDSEAKDRLPKLEHVFIEAKSRGILSIGCMDRGNELGSGTIEEAVRRITPYADKCKCPCEDGTACVVETDIIFPASISNWGAYAITAMLGCLLNKPEVLQDDETEWRMLDACIMAGAVDGIAGAPIMGVDGVPIKAQQGVVNLLGAMMRNALK